MKTKVPIWINILQVIILAILMFQTYASYLNPSLLYPDLAVNSASAKIIYVLAGRNTVMMIISLTALIRQDARFYSFAFLMHSLRELQDMFIVPLTGGGSTGAMIGIFFVFLIVFVTPEITAYFKLNKIAQELESAK